MILDLVVNCPSPSRSHPNSELVPLAALSNPDSCTLADEAKWNVSLSHVVWNCTGTIVVLIGVDWC